MSMPDTSFARPVRLHTIPGGGGLELCVAEAGNPHGPELLFVHGFCQSHQAWQKQLQGPLAERFRLVAMDLRGHGASAKPEEGYADGRLWAEDVHAVITTLGLKRPLLVGWSYGGVVVTDYLRHYGEKNVAGVHFVGALTRLGKPEFFADFGPDFLQLIPGLLSPEPEETLQAQESFVGLLFRQPPAAALRNQVLGYIQAVPLHVRGGVGLRVEEGDDVLRSLTLPVLVSHGLEDKLVLPENSRRIGSLVKHAQLSFYPEAAHSPFWEQAPRFDQELARFAEGCR